MMGSDGETKEGGACSDAENSVFVAVGKNVQKGKSLLSWALKTFPTTKIHVLHVHQPTQSLSLMQGKMLSTKLKQHAVKVCHGLETQKMNKLLDQYCEFVSKEQKKEVTKIWIEMSNVEEGIIELVTRREIRGLVMGVAEKYYSKNLAQIKSRKAIFICRQAPAYCHMWFVCNGCLIYTKSANTGFIKGRLLAASPTNNGGLSSVHKFIEDECDLQILEHPVEPIKEVDDALVANTSMTIAMRGNSLSCFSAEQPALEDPHLQSLSLPVNIFNRDEIDLIHRKLEQAAINAENLKQLAFEESLKRWRAEEDAMEALRKDKASEYLYSEEKSRMKELEDSLSAQMQEIEKLKNQHEGFLTELQLTENQQRVLENHLAESRHLEEELEAKIIQAVKLLITFKEKRDELQREHDTTITEANKLMKSLKEDCTAQFFEFSFLDIMEATQNFDLSWKLHEGRSRVVYKGILRHSKVVIKMLSLSNFHSDQDFLHQVEVLSRVRHPHLVTLMGTCSESRCLIYEYLENGKLEDHLSYEARISALPWQFRMRIAEEICSALVFLHTSSSSLVHGNLTTTNILLDANFVSKIADFGTSLLLSNNGNPNPPTDLKLVGENVEEVSAYMDPNYIESGELTPECDIYSYGIILLRLLTGRPASSVLKDVEFALQSGTLDMMLDSSAGKWPSAQTTTLASLALRCCDMQKLNRPDLVSEVWTAIRETRNLHNLENSSPTLGCLVPKRQHRVPPHFICPIFQDMMKDPYVAADGYTYEGDAIKEWLKGGHKTSPMTNLPLEHCDLLPNNALYYAIQEWQQS